MFGCDPYKNDFTFVNRLKIKIHNQFILKKIFFDITKITRDTIPFYLSRIQKINPVTIWGYPSHVYEIAEYGLQNNINIVLSNLKAIVLSGESFTDLMYNVILKYFNKPIIDEYNSNEGFLASSCQYGRLNINEDTVYMLV
jgi:phenylacetate-CoA ligase